MATTSTHHRQVSRRAWLVTLTVAVAVVAIVVVTRLTAPSAAPTPPQRADTATADSDRGAGDPCALRRETGGGFLEGLDPANRCGDPAGDPIGGGRLP